MLSNLVQETTTTTGTGDLTLSNVVGKVSFNNAFGNGSQKNRFHYFVSHQSASPSEWEVGLGHMSDATTLVRDTVIASSNSNSLVSFSSGTMDVVNDLPADYQTPHGVQIASINGVI